MLVGRENGGGRDRDMRGDERIGRGELENRGERRGRKQRGEEGRWEERTGDRENRERRGGERRGQEIER